MIESFTSAETLPAEELAPRQARCRALLSRFCPDAGGMLFFFRPNIYYLSGTFGNGVLWMPVDGQPVLALRKGEERARLESPLERIVQYRSYSDLPGLFKECGSPLTPILAVERSGLPWSMGLNLTQRLKDYALTPGDAVAERLRAVKTPWEVSKLRLAGARHDLALREMLPPMLQTGLSELRVSHILWEIFFELGHCGIQRMQGAGEEAFQGGTSIGDNANYPTHFNGPMGVKGAHATAPYMGYHGTTLKPGDFLAIDGCFNLEGYLTDKSQLYFNGRRAKIPDIMLRAHNCAVEIQTRAAEQLKPGVTPESLYLQSLDMADRHGFSEGYMGLGRNKVPFLGHGIGLCMDEWPALAKRFTEPLEENMVIALEPKIGLPGLGMAVVENNFLVTPRGGECLTGDECGIICLE